MRKIPYILDSHPSLPLLILLAFKACESNEVRSLYFDMKRLAVWLGISYEGSLYLTEFDDDLRAKVNKMLISYELVSVSNATWHTPSTVYNMVELLKQEGFL